VNRVESVMDQVRDKTLQFPAEIDPVACLFAAAIRAIAGQAELAQAARFAAQRNNFYRGLAADAVRGYSGPEDALAVPADTVLRDLSSDALLAVVSNQV
jgi:hypothetical protein